MPLGGGVCEAGPGVVAGGGVADAGGVAEDGGVTVEGGIVVLGLVVLGLVVLGLLIAPGVLSGGQFTFALLALGLTPEAVVAWLRSVAVPVVVPGTQGLISGTAPGVDGAPGVAVGAVPGTVVPDVVPVVPVFVPKLPGALVAWASASPASAKLKVTIKSNFRMRCLFSVGVVFLIGRAKPCSSPARLWPIMV